jgi:SAM-dependent methyltransferase
MHNSTTGTLSDTGRPAGVKSGPVESCSVEPFPTLCGETTRPYLEQVQPVRELASFRYVRPWLSDVPVLDLGCGAGTYLRHFPPNSLGIDVSRPNLEACRRLHLQVMPADLNRDLPVESSSFAAIFCSHVLEHVDAPIHLLRECRRILTPGGILALGLPIETSLVNRARGQRYFLHHPGHLYSFSLENIQVLLAKVGFDVMRFYFEPRIVRTRWWLALMQQLPSSTMYALALAYWVVARISTSATPEGDHV